MSFFEFTQVMEKLGFGNGRAINDKDKGLFVCITGDQVITGRQSSNTVDIRKRRQGNFNRTDVTKEVALCQ